jgi:hypothetical protein
MRMDEGYAGDMRMKRRSTDIWRKRSVRWTPIVGQPEPTPKV